MEIYFSPWNSNSYLKKIKRAKASDAEYPCMGGGSSQLWDKTPKLSAYFFLMSEIFRLAHPTILLSIYASAGHRSNMTGIVNSMGSTVVIICVQSIITIHIFVTFNILSVTELIEMHSLTYLLSDFTPPNHCLMWAIRVSHSDYSVKRGHHCGSHTFRDIGRAEQSV